MAIRTAALDSLSRCRGADHVAPSAFLTSFRPPPDLDVRHLIVIFPVLSGNDPENYSEKHGVGCVICRNPCFVPNAHIELYGGLSDYSMVSDKTAVNLGLDIRGSYDGGSGDPRSADVQIIHNHKFGQFRIRFCSKKCLQNFFNMVLSKIPGDA